MGFPIFNAILALPAGIFIGRRMNYKNIGPTRVRKTSQQAAIFTTGVMGLVCIVSGSLALIDQSVAVDIQGMLGLPFPVTKLMIIGIILIGGSLLLAFEWWLTIVSVKFGYKVNQPTKLHK